jgi:hypothetical protein
LISARGISYTAHSEAKGGSGKTSVTPQKRAEKGPRVHKEEVLVDMVIWRDNSRWLPQPVRNTPTNRFTLMWTDLCQCYIIRENKRAGDNA